MIFGIKRKIDNFDPYNVFFVILCYWFTGFVVQGHNNTVGVYDILVTR